MDPDTGLLTAYYPAPGASSDGHKHFAVREDIVLSRKSCSYTDLAKAVEPAACKTSEASVGTGVPLWQVALIPVRLIEIEWRHPT